MFSACIEDQIEFFSLLLSVSVQPTAGLFGRYLMATFWAFFIISRKDTQMATLNASHDSWVPNCGGPTISERLCQHMHPRERSRWRLVGGGLLFSRKSTLLRGFQESSRISPCCRDHVWLATPLQTPGGPPDLWHENST